MRYLLRAKQNNDKIEVVLPTSKSISNRALILQALSSEDGKIENLSDCDDTRVMTQAFAGDKTRIDIGAAGTSMRFLTAYLSLLPGVHDITGSERMCNRPIALLVEALRSLGATITYTMKEGYPPLRIEGTQLLGGELSLQGNVSSQYISALLMIAPYMNNGLRLTLVGEVISRPYIVMTLAMMRRFGSDARSDGNTIWVAPGKYTPTHFVVEADWSAASYWYEIVALSGKEITLKGLDRDSVQGDSKIAEFFAYLGVETRYTADGVVLCPNIKPVSAWELDLVEQPDLAQTLVVTAALLNIPFRFTGLQTLKIKETDRIEALKKELYKLGYVIHSENDSVLYWTGERCQTPEQVVIATYEDHRMAMAFAPAALVREGVIVDHPEVVSKSYPRYWDDLRQTLFEITTY